MKQEENVCAKCACFRAKGLRCKNQPLGITHPETESCSRFEERCCGNCAWFYGEMTDGDGFCACLKGSVEFVNCADMCDMREDHFVSRQEMRHYMAVLLQAERWYSAINDPKNYNVVYVPNPAEYRKAIMFAYKYMKVFSKL